MNTTFVALVIALLSLAYFFVKRQFSYWSRRGFLQAEASFPFGSVKGANTTITLTEKLDGIYKQFKGKAPAVGFYNFLGASILPIDPEVIKHIFVKDFQSFHERGFFSNTRDDPLLTK
jgi:cytochrome P450 family 6